MQYSTKLLPYALLFCLLSFGAGVYASFHGPYLGKVIDAETKQPIEGAAVLAVWWQTAPAAHPIMTYHDAQETVTDQQGNFTLPGILGIPPNPQTKIDEPAFYIFQPSYEAIGGRTLKPMPVPKAILEKYKLTDNVYEKDGRIVVELKRLTTREEKLKNLGRISMSSRVPEEKYPNLIRLRDVERVNLGLKPLQTPKEKYQ